jgi:hypothetical protein
MTFDEWYSQNVKPNLEHSLRHMPEPAREPIRQASRESMAACWNAALRAAGEYQNPATAEDIVTHIDSLRVKP